MRHRPASSRVTGRATRASAAALAAASAFACGHVVRPDLLRDRAAPWDVADPPCEAARDPVPAPEGEDAVLLRYLGAGGLYLEWRGAALLTSPFFSRPSLARVLLGRIRSDAGAVSAGLDGVPRGRIAAILAGHAHYDHLADLPGIARPLAPEATLFVNLSAARMLRAHPDLDARTATIEGLPAETWIDLRDRRGKRLPIRFLPILSGHAPHALRTLRWASGEVQEPWSGPWERRRWSAMKAGRTYAFVIDLLAADLASVRFRLYVNDAAPDGRDGAPPASAAADGHRIDLAVLCLAGFNQARDYPGGLVRRLHPRHVLVGHWENFMRGRGRPLRFAPLIGDRRAGRFLSELRDALEGSADPAAAPDGDACGPAGAGWTMPLPGAWARFRPVATTAIGPPPASSDAGAFPAR